MGAQQGPQKLNYSPQQEADNLACSPFFGVLLWGKVVESNEILTTTITITNYTLEKVTENYFFHENVMHYCNVDTTTVVTLNA